jgi:hypothetical protein
MLAPPPYAIDWDEMAKRHGYGSELAMWADLRSTKRMTIKALSLKLGVSIHPVRKALTRCGIPDVKRGGGHYVKFRMDDADLVRLVEEIGMTKAAKQIGVSRTCIYLRMRNIRNGRPNHPNTQAKKD